MTPETFRPVTYRVVKQARGWKQEFEDAAQCDAMDLSPPWTNRVDKSKELFFALCFTHGFCLRKDQPWSLQAQHVQAWFPTYLPKPLS